MQDKRFKKVSDPWEKGSTPSEKLILLAIAEMQSKNRRTSAQQIANLTGLSRESVSRNRYRLEQAGILELNPEEE